jgi:LacI family transcriptional regulator
MRDVALRAGVSTATVSRSLTGSRKVSEQVLLSVLAAAQDLDYQTNRLAASLRRRVTNSIGLVVPEIGNPFFPALVESIERELGRSERQLLLCDSRLDSATESRRLGALMQQQVDGVLISPCDATKSHHAVVAAAAKVPLVQLDREIEDNRLDWVGLDDHAGMNAVVRHLAECGARSLMFVSAEPTNSSARRRLKGFLDSAFECGLNITGVLLGTFKLSWGAQAAAKVAESHPRPDAVVCGNDLIAIGMLRELALLNVQVPQELMVTGFDDIFFSECYLPSLTTVRQPHDEIAAVALRILAEIESSSKARHRAQRVAVVPSLVVRESTTARASSFPEAASTGDGGPAYRTASSSGHARGRGA